MTLHLICLPQFSDNNVGKKLREGTGLLILRFFRVSSVIKLAPDEILSECTDVDFGVQIVLISLPAFWILRHLLFYLTFPLFYFSLFIFIFANQKQMKYIPTCLTCTRCFPTFREVSTIISTCYFRFPSYCCTVLGWKAEILTFL